MMLWVRKGEKRIVAFLGRRLFMEFYSLLLLGFKNTIIHV